MKRTIFFVFGLLAMRMAMVCGAEPVTQPGWFQPQGRTAELMPKGNIRASARTSSSLPSQHPKSLDSQNQPSVAEATSPEIEALARGLENDPLRIFNYVHDHICYVFYFGSKKGAQLTLLEKSGNDFDQAALLVALLRAAGYSDAGYQFGWMFIPYDNPDQSHQDLHHWLGLDLVNTNWLSTSNYLVDLVSQRGYPIYSVDSTSNAFGFQRVWVTLPIGGTNYYLDPAFKVSEPIAGIDVPTAMGFGSNALMTAAGGTDTGNYVTNLNEAALRDKLRDYTTNLVAFIQSNYPNASVQEILSGQRIIPSPNSALSQSLLFQPYDFGGTLPVISWVNEPTNIMSTLSITFAGTNHFWFMPQLQGQRLTLVFDSSGLAQLWQDDTNLAQHATSGSASRTNVVVSIDHPVGHWDLTHNTFIDTNYFDQITTNSYQRTNATYALLYGFEPDAGWLQERQNQLAAYRQRGLADTSLPVVSETLNVMGHTWLLEITLAEQMLASQLRILPQHYHVFGRMAQERSLGYYVDVYMAVYTPVARTGNDATSQENTVRHFDLNAYFGSALEHGMIEQQQSSNLLAASTVKVLQLANTNGQAIYLASSTNWTTGANVKSHLVNYDLNYLESYINAGYKLLLPRNGSNSLAGAGSWAGAGFVGRYRQGVYEHMPMVISGAYHGGYAGFPGSTADPGFVDQSSAEQPGQFNPAPATQARATGADPVNMVDASFQIQALDLSLGGREPRGLSFARYYSSSRRNNNPAAMAPGWIHSYYVNLTDVSAPQAGLGSTTPAQMAPMLAAVASAIGIYDSATPDPKNWLSTALIAKWGVDQLTKNGVSVMLGNDTIQFTRQPNGLFTPPAGSTMTLLKTNSVYWLLERHGNTFKFNSLGLLVNIVDQYNQTLTVAYQASNWVSSVTDWKNHSLTFSYGGTPLRLAYVSDSTGRSNIFGYSTSFSPQGDLTSVTDPEGKTSTFLLDTNHQITASFDALNQLVVSNIYDGFARVITQHTQGDTNKTWQIYWSGFANVERDPVGSRRVFFFDDKHRQIGLQDALGNVFQTFYDGQDHAVTNLSPLNETSHVAYDGNHNPIYSIDPLGFTNTLVYDSKFNLIQAIDSRGNSSYFGYNTQSSLTGSTNGAGDWVTLSYHSDGTPSTRVDAGGTTTFTQDSANGYLNGITYPGGLGVDGFLNNALGDTLSHTNARGFVTSFQFNLRRQPTSTIGPTNLSASLAYDAIGNAKTNTDARALSTVNIWSPTRKLLSTTLPSTPQGSPVRTNIYDVRDWLVRTFDPLQAATGYTNDIAGRLIALADPVLRTTRFAYDADGHRTFTTNAALEVSQQTWNARGESPASIDPATNKVGRAFDAAGNQIYLTNRNGKLWQFQFDKANRLTNTITPRGASTKVAFNNRGLRQLITQPSGNTNSLLYDAKARPVSITDKVGTRTNIYDANNNLLSMAENGQMLQRTYDAYDRLTSYQDASGNLIQYRRDANGNVTNLVYPGGKNVYYAFDSLNRMTNVTDWATRKTSFTYDLANRLKTIARPNGTVRTISYDAAGETTNIFEQAQNGGPIAYFKLNWSAAARVEWEFSGPLPHAYTPPSRTMDFDDDNRLATFNGSYVTNDSDGNLIWGPLTNSTLGSLTFNARNQLLAAGGLSYGYDPAGNRTSLTNGTNVTTFVINPGAALSQVLMRIKNGVTNYYIYGVGFLYEADDAGNTKTYHYDYRGSTVAITDGSGTNVTDRIEYSVYGLTTYRVGTTDTPFLYNGRYGVMSDANGLLFMRSRYYNPYLCRFINPDPSGFSGGLNFFAYADGNPASLLDPFGLGAAGETRVPGLLNNGSPYFGTPCIACHGVSGQGFNGNVDSFYGVEAIPGSGRDAMIGYAVEVKISEMVAPLVAAPVGGLIASGLGVEFGAAELTLGAIAAEGPLASVLEGHGAGQGFTGVFDAATGKVLIRPSTAEAVIPEGWVARAGGHADVSAAIGGDAGGHSGFAVILQENGSLNITWRSGTLNRTPGSLVPTDLRPTIVDAVKAATGRTVNP